MNQSRDSSDRSVSIGGNSTRNIIQTGDRNIASLNLIQTTLPAPETVAIEPEVAAVYQLLSELSSEDHQKIMRAMDDAQEELAKADPNREEVGIALKRAFQYAKNAETFATTATNLRSHVTNIVA
ncbi:MAG: hypothetical protein KDA77_23410, partial [Planctomycetaceae bacterium]|nr:hypothetical protein [Planctomycetaceae bacterium]